MRTKGILILTVLGLILLGCGKVIDAKKYQKQDLQKVETLSSESIYQMTDQFVNQDNKTVQLEDFKGKPTVISMMFTSCGYACPRLTADISKIEKKLGKEAKDINVVLVSFDVERDTPEVLKEYATSHGFDKWTLLHGDDAAVQSLSILLNIPFNKDENGDFSHGNMVTVLDENGVIVNQIEGLGNDPMPTVNAVEKLLKKKA